MTRTLLAVLGGVLTTVVLVGLTTWAAAAALGIAPGRPTTAYLAANLALSAASAVAGGYAAAALASRARLAHAGALAVVLLALSIYAIAQPVEVGQPPWYPYALTALGPLGALAGGAIRARRGDTR